MNIYAQIFGTIAMLLLIASYFNTQKKEYLFTQILCNIFFAIQYLILNATTAVINTFIAITRSIVFYLYTKRKKEIPIKTLIIFEILILLLIITTCKDLISILPLLIAALYTYGTWQKNLKKTYIIGSIVAIIWIFYNYVVGAYVSALGSVFELLSSINGVYRIKRKLIIDKNKNI